MTALELRTRIAAARDDRRRRDGVPRIVCILVFLLAATGCASWNGSSSEASGSSDGQRDSASAPYFIDDLDPAAQERVALMTEDVRERLGQAADFLAAAKVFGLIADTSFDVHQRDGRLLEFGNRLEVTIRRPDSVRVDATRRDGETRSIRFDGRTFAIEFPDHAAFVRIPLPGTYYAAFDHVRENLASPIPLAHLFSENFGAKINAQVESGYVVGPATVDGRDCDHLAFRLPEVDMQMWIAVGDRPLITRLVITYKHAEGNPQFRATFRNWVFDLDPAAELFQLDPKEGSRELEVEVFLDSSVAGGEEPQG